MTLQYKVNDIVVYPAQGIARIVNIEYKLISGKEQGFYVLSILDTDMRILLPVDKAKHTIRPLMSQATAEEVWKTLAEPTTAHDQLSWNKRYRKAMETLHRSDPIELAELFRDFYHLAKTKDRLSFGERRMLDITHNLLVKELAVATKQSENTIDKRINILLGALTGEP